MLRRSIDRIIDLFHEHLQAILEGNDEVGVIRIRARNDNGKEAKDVRIAKGFTALKHCIHSQLKAFDIDRGFLLLKVKLKKQNTLEGTLERKRMRQEVTKRDKNLAQTSE